MPKSNVERQLKHRAEMRKRGYKMVNVWVKPNDVARIREMARRLREANDALTAPRPK